MSLLDEVITFKLVSGFKDREESLWSIYKDIEASSPYAVAKHYGVLRNHSAEDFMIEYMTAFNKEVCPKY